MRSVNTSEDQIIVLDDFNTSSTHFNASLIALSSIILISSFFVLVDHVSPILARLVLLFLSQIILGILLIRLFYYLGRKARLSITLIDPSSINHGWKRSIEKMNSAEMSHVFERMQISASVPKSRMDDLTDLSLFIVIVWSVISTAFIYPDMHTPLLYFIGGSVLLVACVLSYLNGYGSFVVIDFNEELSKLEYYVVSRVSAVERIAKVNSYIIWLEKNGHRILYDIMVDIDVGPPFKLSYHCGISSSDNERIQLENLATQTPAPDQVSRICSKFLNIQPNWDVHVEDRGNGFNIIFYNKTHPVKYKSGSTPISNAIISNDAVQRFSKGLIELINCCVSWQSDS